MYNNQNSQSCNSEVLTRVEYETGLFTWVLVGGLCIVGYDIYNFKLFL